MANDLNRHYRMIGRRLRLARAVLDLTEAQAADVFGCTVATYRKREAGCRWNDIDGMCAFANRFNVNLDWLWDGEPSRVGRALSYDAPGKVAVLPVVSAKRRKEIAGAAWGA